MLRDAEKEERLSQVVDGPEDVDVRSFSWWTTKKKIIGAALLAGLIGVAGYGVDRVVTEGRRKAGIQRVYDLHVKKEVTPYLDHSKPERMLDNCVVSGRVLDHYKESSVVFGGSKRNFVFSATGETKIPTPPCIVPGDGDQKIDLESRVRVSRLDYDDITGLFAGGTGLYLTPSFPGILAPDFSVKDVTINSRPVPLDYLDIEHPEGAEGSRLYLDISRLVKDGVLSREDFRADLDVRISSHLDLKPSFSVTHVALLGKDRYPSLRPYLAEFIESTRRFPHEAPAIKRIVSSYSGPDKVLPKLLYSLAVTDMVLDYKVQDHERSVLDALKDGIGDCSEYTNLFVTLARGFGIPTRKLTGIVLDSQGKFSGYHAWAEVLIPLEGGKGRWVLVEPTWADDKEDAFRYIGYQGWEHLYFVDFDVSLSPPDNQRYSVFQHHRWESRKKGAGR